MDIRELVHRLRCGQSNRAVAQALGINRKTVARYRAWATEQGLLTGPLPPLGELHQLLAATLPGTPPPQNVSSVAPHRDLVVQLRQQGVERAAIWERLKERGYTGSYSAVYRFVHQLEPPTPDVTVRVETRPGEEAQVDFGFAGRLIDPDTDELRKAWAFVMTLSWSRHQYVEFVWDQQVGTWLLLHRHALAFFAGVPERVVIDNLKAGISHACWHEPQAQQSYRECAEHYGFLISPCRPRTPQHKGKVEQGGVHYVKRNFLAGREPTTLTQANRDVRRWVLTTAGQRIHGTTKERPLDRFASESAALQPLPPTPYDLAVWKQVKLHRDCYVVFEGAYYSAPFRLVDQQLWVRGGAQTVQIYTPDYQLVATHTRAQQAGRRLTHPDHLPTHKVPGLMLTRENCRQQAREAGPATGQVVAGLLDHRPEDRLRTAARLLRLGERFSPARLEAACARALRFDDPSYLTIKRTLEQGLEAEELPPPAAPPPARTFVRTAAELVGHLIGGDAWN
ncbi:MAG: IS21 family transposase [Chloroflexi bacterium]|nr:IS21 family transposase [Chloroflexota bacterium]